ncbi:MAG: hypothetical protein COY74_03610, partial [Nitrosopumilales archaeon CG_4_10_14_0_8_um_filter_34_8]
LNGRVGPLFQGRFKAVRIENDEQLIHVSRYIHLNPYSSGFVKNIKKVGNYPYSSLGEYVHGQKPGCCCKKVILDYFRDSELYRKFVNDHADYQKNLQMVKPPLV